VVLQDKDWATPRPEIKGPDTVRDMQNVSCCCASCNKVGKY